MELLILMVVGLLIAICVLPFVALAKANSAKRGLDDLATRFSSLENEVRSLGRHTTPAPKSEAAVVAVKAVPPPVPTTTAALIGQEKESVPPPIPERFVKATVPQIAAPARPPINWEQFMGAKLFAWIGGLALFLGVAFFVKYSFEHNLIPPELQIAIGFTIGVILLIGGLLLKRKENAVTAQTLCATGILVLYAVTFACRGYYHFAFFGLIPTFLLMTLITAMAFLLAVRLNAMVVAVLGIAGGFLTPVLLSTGEDYPLGLFVYIALLDVGLLAVAQRQRWNALAILGALGTALMQFAWITTFFVPEKYFGGNKVLVVMAVFAGFQGLFLAAVAWAKRTRKMNHELLACALGLAGAAILAAFYLLSFPTIAHRPTLLFSYVFIVDLGLLALTLLESRLTIVNALAGLAAFILLAAWTNSYLSTAYLYTALTFYFIFALFHSAIPLVLQRVRKIHVPWWSQAFPAVSLLLMLMPIFQITELSIVVWPFVLIVDLLAFGLALATGRLLPIVAMLLLTLIAVGGWLLRISSELTGLPTALCILGSFAIFFLFAASWACRRFIKAGTRAPKLFGDITDPRNLSVQLPALSAAMPFLLLIMVTLRLPLVNPSAVFGLALLLVILLLGMSEILLLDVLPAIGLACVLALEHAWHFQHFDPTRAT